MVNKEIINKKLDKAEKLEIIKSRVALNNDNLGIGGSLIGYLEISYSELVDILGEPNSEGDCYKTDAEWDILYDGTPFSIYNYKDGINYNGEIEGIPTECITEWHVGGENEKKGRELIEFMKKYRVGSNEVNRISKEDIIKKIEYMALTNTDLVRLNNILDKF